jgi:hypothetical protein
MERDQWTGSPRRDERAESPPAATRAERKRMLIAEVAEQAQDLEV